VAILRVNQLDPETADFVAGWANLSAGAPVLAGIEAPWPAGVNAYELRIIPQQGEGKVPEAEVRARVRRLVCETLPGLAPAGHMALVRVDGPLVPVLPVLAWAMDKPLGMSPVRRFAAHEPGHVSIRVPESLDAMGGLCDALGPALGRDVRVRALAVPEELVPPLLDMDTPDDERWRDVLAGTKLMIDTTTDARGLIVYTRLGADDVTTKLAERLGK
jgi:hypothetical protein